MREGDYSKEYSAYIDYLASLFMTRVCPRCQIIFTLRTDAPGVICDECGRVEWFNGVQRAKGRLLKRLYKKKKYEVTGVLEE